MKSTRDAKIAKLRSQILRNRQELDMHDFTSIEDIDDLSSRVTNLYKDYKDLAKCEGSDSLSYVLMFVLGIISLMIAGILFLGMNESTTAIFELICNNTLVHKVISFIITLPGPIVVKLALFVFIGVVFVMWGVIRLTSGASTSERIADIEDEISDIFRAHIVEDSVGPETMKIFRRYISNMRKNFHDIDNANDKIKRLERENKYESNNR